MSFIPFSRTQKINIFLNSRILVNHNKVQGLSAVGEVVIKGNVSLLHNLFCPNHDFVLCFVFSTFSNLREFKLIITNNILFFLHYHNLSFSLFFFLSLLLSIYINFFISIFSILFFQCNISHFLCPFLSLSLYIFLSIPRFLSVREFKLI